MVPDDQVVLLEVPNECMKITQLETTTCVTSTESDNRIISLRAAGLYRVFHELLMVHPHAGWNGDLLTQTNRLMLPVLIIGDTSEAKERIRQSPHR